MEIDVIGNIQCFIDDYCILFSVFRSQAVSE